MQKTEVTSNVSQADEIKVCPWLCRTCELAPASCGKSIAECEDANYRINEYERGGCRA